MHSGARGHRRASTVGSSWAKQAEVLSVPCLYTIFSLPPTSTNTRDVDQRRPRRVLVGVGRRRLRDEGVARKARAGHTHGLRRQSEGSEGAAHFLEPNSSSFPPFFHPSLSLKPLLTLSFPQNSSPMPTPPSPPSSPVPRSRTWEVIRSGGSLAKVRLSFLFSLSLSLFFFPNVLTHERLAQALSGRSG
jgi:hypothetical protein